MDEPKSVTAHFATWAKVPRRPLSWFLERIAAYKEVEHA